MFKRIWLQLKTYAEWLDKSRCGGHDHLSIPDPERERPVLSERRDRPRKENTVMGQEPRRFVKSVHGIRYQVKDVARAISFYTNHLGFNLERQQLPAFANVSLGDAQIL